MTGRAKKIARVAEMAHPSLGRWGVMVGEHCLLRLPDTQGGKHEAQWQVNRIVDALLAFASEENNACADRVEAMLGVESEDDYDKGWNAACRHIIAALRARQTSQ